ncbi:MAG TPA: hypothetical protein VMY37_10165 [Thermoguttaceae bacterium]|nr:hypothetical protein [Thermoguttaceae bacterium]
MLIEAAIEDGSTVMFDAEDILAVVRHPQILGRCKVVLPHLAPLELDQKATAKVLAFMRKKEGSVLCEP